MFKVGVFVAFQHNSTKLLYNNHERLKSFNWQGWKNLCTFLLRAPNMLVRITIQKFLSSHSMPWGINPPPKHTHTPTPTHTLFFAKLSLKAGTIQAPLFRQSLCFIGFCEPLPSKNQIFQWNPIILKVSSLTPYHLLKVNKLLVETSQQFTFLAMTEKHFCL